MVETISISCATPANPLTPTPLLTIPVPDEVEEGVDGGDLLVLGAGSQLALDGGVPGVDRKHAPDPDNGGADGRGEVVQQRPRAHASRGLGVQLGQTWKQHTEVRICNNAKTIETS